MSSFYTNISENAERVIDPISEQVIYSLVRKLGCHELFKDNTHFQNDRSANSMYDNPDHTLNFVTQNRLDVQVDTHYNPADNQLFEGMNMGSNTPSLWMGNYNKSNKRIIFADPAIKFCVRELNMPFTITFNLNMRFREYDGAMLALSNILNRSHAGFINEVHDIVYSYPFDRTSWAILLQVFKYRTSYRDKNPEAKVIDYLDSISKAQWGFDIRRPDLTETAVAKADTEATVTRQQMSCSAKLEFSGGKPEPIMQENQPVGYTLECTYTIQFGRPHLLEFDVPPVIEQKPLPAVFFHSADYSTDDPKLYGEASDPSVTGMMWQAANGAQVRVALHKMPEYDDWFTPYGTTLRLWKFIPVVEAIVTVDKIGEAQEIDLKNLGEAKIADWVLEILGTMDTSDILGYNGIFNITIFADNTKLDTSFVSWDKENKILSFTGDKKEAVYRMVFAEASDLRYIDKKWAQTLIKYYQYIPCALMRTMGYLSRVGVLWIIGDASLNNFVSKALHNGTLGKITEAMIKKKCPTVMRQYLSDATAYVKYICNTTWGDRRYTLFDVFIETATQLGYLSNNDTLGRLLNVDGIYNYDFTVGGLPNGHNEPLRFFEGSLSGVK